MTDDSEGNHQRDYVPLILQIMADAGVSQRSLAARTGISKSRLGLILHSDAAKRSPMMLAEFQTILHALGTNMVEAYIRLVTLEDLEPEERDRFATVVPMVCETFVTLSRQTIDVLKEREGIDGSEVRKEWAAPLQRAVVKKLTDEATATAERRVRIVDSDDFRI